MVLPSTSCSWSNNLTLEKFDLSVFFRGTFGFDVFNMRKYGMGLQGCGTDNVLALRIWKIRISVPVVE